MPGRSTLMRWAAALLVTAAGWGTAAAPAAAAAPEPVTPDTLPLIGVPAGCAPAPVAHVVFEGTVVDGDFRSIRYRVDTIRDGTTVPFGADTEAGTLIDVRYGLDVQYLTEGERYLVGAVVDTALGLLVSHVGEPIEDFGGDEVIGVSESDVNCPEFEDPARTLHLDGTEIDTPLLAPLLDSEWRLAAAVVVPFAVALAAVFALSLVRLSATGAINAVRRD